DVFLLFKDIYILTYLFRGQLQKSYFDIHGVKYRYLSVVKNDGDYAVIPYKDRLPMDKTILAEKISIYEGSLNNIGDKHYSLSMNWFNEKKNKNAITTLKNHTRNYFMNKKKVKVADTIWTTFKGGEK